LKYGFPLKSFLLFDINVSKYHFQKSKTVEMSRRKRLGAQNFVLNRKGLYPKPTPGAGRLIQSNCERRATAPCRVHVALSRREPFASIEIAWKSLATRAT
jgi:hypothetical protein